MPAPARHAAVLLLILVAAALLPGPPLGPVVEVARPRWLWPALSSGLGARPWRPGGDTSPDALKLDGLDELDRLDDEEPEPEAARGVIASPLDEEWP